MSAARSEISQAADGRVALHRAGSASELEGYRAAGILIERMLDEAQKKCPKRLMKINRNSAAYRAGVYQAILTARCLMVYGEHPNHPENQAQIRKIIQTPNKSSLLRTPCNELKPN